jgi:hypothetical protein
LEKLLVLNFLGFAVCESVKCGLQALPHIDVLLLLRFIGGVS